MNIKKYILFVVSSIILITLLYVVYQIFGMTENTRELDMVAPALKTDINGLVFLEQCPTNYNGIRIVLEGDNNVSSAKVYKNDLLFQVLECENTDDVLASDIEDIKDQKNVHFIDVNYDGYVDLYFGTSKSRTKNSVFLWNPTSGKFQQAAKDEMLQYLILEPSTKSLYQGGTGSWCYHGISKYKWRNNSLTELESLDIVSDASEYEDYDVTHKFSIKNEGIIVSETDDISELPEKWRILYEKYMEMTD